MCSACVPRRLTSAGAAASFYVKPGASQMLAIASGGRGLLAGTGWRAMCVAAGLMARETGRNRGRSGGDAAKLI